MNAAIVLLCGIVSGSDASEQQKSADEAYAAGRFDTAIQHFNEVIRLDPQAACAYHGRGAAYMQLKKFPEAIESLSHAVRLQPENDAILVERAGAHWQLNETEKAIADLTRCLKLNERNWPALNELAWILSMAPEDDVRDGPRAVKFAVKACEATDWKNPFCLSTLSAAYAETGRYHHAVLRLREAMKLPDFPGHRRERAELRLQLYADEKPFHLPADTPAGDR